jgi:cell division protein FtsQ
VQQMKRKRIEPVLRRGAPAPGDEDWRPWLDPAEPEPEPPPPEPKAAAPQLPPPLPTRALAAAEVPEAPMAEPRGLRRDPAPSRTAYRLNRLWLTPFYRALLRKGLPAFLLIFCAGLWLTDDARLTAMGRWVGHLRASITQRPEFLVTLLRIEGASDETAEKLRQTLGLTLPASSFDLDLDKLHAAVTGLDAVASARLTVRKGGVLEVAITERVPAVVWRSATGIGTLDASGHPVATLLSRLERPDLPLIVGEGADREVAEALRLFAAAGPIQDRIRGFVRIGARRWDVIVEPAIRLMLPETDPVPALEHLVALQQAQQLLDHDIVAVDLRLPARTVVRLGAPAAETYRQTQAAMRGSKTK